MQISLYVFSHEIRKVIQDKKILVSIILLPILIIFITSFLSTSISTSPKGCIYALNNTLEKKETTKYSIIPVNQKTIEEFSETTALYPEDVVIHIQHDKTDIYYNSLNSSSAENSLIAKDLLIDCYPSTTASIQEKEISQKITINDINPESNSSGKFMAIMLPYMLILLLFQSTSDFAIDTIAGEKENGVFSTIILTPHKPNKIILGKLIACIVYGIITTASYFIIVYCVSLITGSDSYNIKAIDLNISNILFFTFGSVLLSFLFASLAVLCALYSKSPKEARSLRLPVYAATLILALPAFIISESVPSIYYLIPIYNISCVMKNMLSGGADVMKTLLTLLSLAVCSALAFTFSMISLKNEEVRC